jgi:two-component system, LytTR family, sensor kinase
MNVYSELTPTEAKPRSRSGRFKDWPLAAKSILAFWAVYYLTVVLRAFLSADPGTVLFNRSLTLGIGVILTFGIYVAYVLLASHGTLRRRIVIGLLGSLIAASTQAGLLLVADRYLEKPQDEMRFVSREGHQVVESGNQIRIERDGQALLQLTIPRVHDLDPRHRLRYAADTTVTWFFFFAAWSAFYMAMLAQAQTLGLQRRAAEAESAARAAQVRALRYQVNPHFLFNTLNSLSSLVMSKRPEEAEQMILKLSTFFRSSLSLDPTADVTLAQEIELQRLYLDIEKVRFPRRLKVEIDVPEELEAARVPGLILQPVVENAIKYGVAGARERVELRISAREAGPGRFRLEVTNSAGGPAGRKRAEQSPGTGVGLTNVCQRMEARFGELAVCEHGPLPEGGYRVTLTLPLDRSNG